MYIVYMFKNWKDFQASTPQGHKIDVFFKRESEGYFEVFKDFQSALLAANSEPSLVREVEFRDLMTINPLTGIMK